MWFPSVTVIARFPRCVGYHRNVKGSERKFTYAQNPLHQFPRNFPVDGEAVNLLATWPTSRQQVGNKSL